MPGFSRTSDPPNFVDYSLTQAAGEIAALVRSLGLSPATFYGCSSGGVVALCLTSDHSELVREVVVHEVPLSPPGEWLSRLTMLDDDQIIRACQDRFRNQMNENAEAWDALGKAYHRRLERNYVTWVHHYIQQNRYLRTFTTEELQRRSIIWTIGGLNPVEAFFDNVVMAHTAGIPIGLLRCRHFPQVSVPEVIAAHIGKAAREANILHK
jgi:pimeloyl-ACP methyl ester carboxylesterase